MPAAHPADVHGGDTAEAITAALAGAFDTVVQALAALELRPTAVEVHRQLHLTDVAVYFPHADVASVDALGDRFRLQPIVPGYGAARTFYVRTGLVEFGADRDAFSLTVRCLQPGLELPDPLAAAATPADDPIVITGELARLELPAGDDSRSRGELVVP